MTPRLSRSRWSVLLIAVAMLSRPSAVWSADLEAPLSALKSGNERFVRDVSAAVPIDRERRVALTKGQAPFAVVLSCADSRVPPELVFNVGLGDLFVVRAAGEVVDRAILGSIEYGVEHLNAPLLVIMGHESCGAVMAASEAPSSSLGPNLDFLVSSIRPAVPRAVGRPEAERIKTAILRNVEQVVGALVARSAIVRQRVDERKLLVVGAYYELESGRVHFSQPLARPASGVVSSAHR